MDWAAELKYLDIQYCLTLPRFVLFSTELDSVSHARGSPDYAYNFLQWNIGFQSLWGEAAGLAVLKVLRKKRDEKNRDENIFRTRSTRFMSSRK